MFRRRCHGIGSPMSLLGAKFLGPEGDVHGTPLTIAALGLVNTEQRYDHRDMQAKRRRADLVSGRVRPWCQKHMLDG